MALKFIPNQPIIFNDPLFAGQTCLNSDVREYAQLAQPDDVTCVQWQIEPTGNISNCAMNLQPNTITNGQFDTLLTGWQQIDLYTGTIGPPTNYSYTGSGAVTSGGPIALFTSTGIPVGNLVMLSFFVSDPTVQIFAGVGDAATNSWNSTYSAQVNYDGRVVWIVYAATGSDIAFFPNGAVEFRDVQVRDITLSNCYTPNNESFYWSYVESLNGFELISNSLTPQPLLLSNNFINGQTYRISFKVKEMPVSISNFIYIKDNTTNDVIVSANGNAEFVFWYIHTNASTQVSINVSDWTGSMLGTILYDLNIEYFNFDYTASIILPDGSPISIDYTSSSPSNAITFYEDRMIWCIDWNTLEDVDVPGAPINSGCYKVKIRDNTSGLFNISYTLVNYQFQGHPCSVPVIGSNQGYAFGFFFNEPGVNVVFTLFQRLRILQFNPYYPAKSEEYLYSNGNHVRTYAESAKFRTAWFDYVDEPTHDVIRLQLLSDTLIVGDQPFFCAAEDYEPEWAANGKYNLAQSRVVLKAVNEPSLFNKFCQ